VDQEIPRRIQIQKMTPAELAIRTAMLEVEKLPPDARLTDAVVLLGQAQEKVANFVDGKMSAPGKAKAKDEQVFTNKLLRDFISEAKRLNASTLTLRQHNCGKFEGWCLHLTVCEHSDCEDESEG
jgi:hypothetical protein